jgi:hypothetical protein
MTLFDRTMFPLVTFEEIPHYMADEALVKWEHWLGGCNRPFGRQSFGLFVMNKLVSVAVSASTVNERCGGMSRFDVVELARQCSDPAHKWATRVMVRLWRELAPQSWPHWPVKVCVSYSNALRHSGDIYRFDGWTRVADVKGGNASKTWGDEGRRKTFDPKTVWAYALVPWAFQLPKPAKAEPAGVGVLPMPEFVAIVAGATAESAAALAKAGK